MQDNQNQVAAGGTSGISASAPPGLAIASITIPSMKLHNTVGTGYVAYVVWTGGDQRVDDNWLYYSLGLNPPVSSVGITLGCAGPSQCVPDGASFYATDFSLGVVETVPPTITAVGADNLWYRAEVGWARGGGWSIAYSATAPSGIDTMSASENGVPVTSPLPPTCVPNNATWQQCPSPQIWSPTVSLAGNGAQQLTISATSAAGNTSPYTETMHVDNTQPILALSGPTVASSTAGTQYITATATVGPSGLGSIDCSIDGGPTQSFRSSPAQVPVSGAGEHNVSCNAQNRAFDVNGQPAVSAPASWQLHIGQPTVSGISFSKLVRALRCRRVRDRVHVPARWVLRRHRGKVIRVHRGASTKVVKVTKCHARTARRVVTVYRRVKRHGRTVVVKRRRIERVVVAPHLRNRSVEVVRYGQGAVVHGWLGTSSGVALPGRSVVVMTAVDNGRGAWRPAAGVTTGPNGSWSARLPRGPSRLVEALYAGDPTTLGSSSTTVRLAVPARINLQISPRSTRWGGRINISGRVFGGYIPTGKLLRLRIGVEGVRGTVGIPSIAGRGRFHTTWTFSAGHGVVRYWFSVSTLNEADYPFAPGSSKRVYVTVGPG